MASFEMPSITAGPLTLGAPGDFCVAYNPCSSSYMIQVTPEIAASVAANPLLGAALRIAPSFGIGVSMTGRLERALRIPLWDGSRPEWVSEEFNLLDNGHFWLDLEMSIGAELILGPEFKGKFTLQAEADIMFNVSPRLLSDLHHTWTKVGTGFTLDNGKDGIHSNVLHIFPKTAEEGKTVEKCKFKCDEFDECRFISIDVQAEICILYKRANTLKAKRHTEKELLEKFGVTVKVQSWQSDAALKPMQGVDDDEKTAKELDAASTCSNGGNDKTDKTNTMEEYKASPAEDKDPSGSGILNILKRIAFTASVQGKVTLAMHLGSLSLGMIDFSVTLQCAIALRKGNVPNPGMYITLDLSGEGRARAGTALQKFTKEASKTINTASDSIDAAAAADTTGTIAKNPALKVPKIDSEGLVKKVSSIEAKAGAFMNLYVKDLDNFGFKTGITTCRPSVAGGSDGACESHYFVVKRVHGNMYLCYSTGNGLGHSQRCMGSLIEILGVVGEALVDGAKAAVRLVAAVGAKALAIIGEFTQGVGMAISAWGDQYTKALGKNLAASASITTESVGAAAGLTANVVGSTASFTADQAVALAKATKEGDVLGMVGGLGGTVGGGIAVGTTAIVGGVGTAAAAIGGGTLTCVCAVGSFCNPFGWRL